MQLGSAVSGVQRCQSEAAATKPQRKVWAESGRSEDQNGACACTNAGSHMHKRRIYTKIPAVHTAMVVCPTSQQHLQESCRRGFCCFLSGMLADNRDMGTSWFCWFWACSETTLWFILMSLSAAVLKTTWIMWHTCGHISSFLTSVSDQQRNDTVVVKGALPVGKF